MNTPLREEQIENVLALLTEIIVILDDLSIQESDDFSPVANLARELKEEVEYAS